MWKKVARKLENRVAVDTGMSLPTFCEYVAMREGVLTAPRPPFQGMTRLNALPTTEANRKRLHTPKLVKVPNPFKPVTRIKPTVRHVAEIVPQRMVAKLPFAPITPSPRSGQPPVPSARSGPPA
jgi:hypothetical protein